MRMRSSRVGVMFLGKFNRYNVQFAMPHTVGSNYLIGKSPDILNRSSKDDNFEAIIVIHMDMHTR